MTDDEKLVLSEDEPGETDEVVDVTDADVEDATQPEKDVDGTKADAEDTPTEADDEPEWEGYHEVSYKADGKEDKLRLEYDEKGNLTPATIEKLQQLAAKSVGLESKTQRTVEEAKGYQRQLEAERTRAHQAEIKLQQLEESSKPVLEYLSKNPEIVQALRERGMAAPPDPELIRLRIESQQNAQKERVKIENDFKNSIAYQVSTKYPETTPDQWRMIGEYVDENELLEVIPAGNKTPEQLQKAVQQILEGVRAQFIIDGKLPDPRNQRIANLKQETAQKIEKAEKAKALRNPLAGGSRPASKGKVTKLITWADVQRDPSLQDKKLAQDANATQEDFLRRIK